MPRLSPRYLSEAVHRRRYRVCGGVLVWSPCHHVAASSASSRAGSHTNRSARKHRLVGGRVQTPTMAIPDRTHKSLIFDNGTSPPTRLARTGMMSSTRVRVCEIGRDPVCLGCECSINCTAVTRADTRQFHLDLAKCATTTQSNTPLLRCRSRASPDPQPDCPPEFRCTPRSSTDATRSPPTPAPPGSPLPPSPPPRPACSPAPTAMPPPASARRQPRTHSTAPLTSSCSSFCSSSLQSLIRARSHESTTHATPSVCSK